MIRYHSFYPLAVTSPLAKGGSVNHSHRSWHREGAYRHLTNPADEKALTAVRAFNPYDLYSKSDNAVDANALKPYYSSLIAKFFPEIIEW